MQFFRWRTTRVGTEQHWEGILCVAAAVDGTPARLDPPPLLRRRNWDGNTSTARYANVARIGAEFARVSPHVFRSRVRARVAILHSPETRWAFQEQPLTTPQGFAVEPQVRVRE